MTELPPWQGFMVPTLKAMSEGQARHWSEMQPLIADVMGLSAEQRAEMLPSGRKVKYKDRIGWCVSYLTIVGALERVKRGHYQITDAGRALLAQYPDGVTEQQVRALGEDPASLIRPYKSTVKSPAQTTTQDAAPPQDELTPSEQIHDGIQRIQDEVGAEVLTRLQQHSPAFFEQAVVDLLLAMGYGGEEGSGQVTQLTHDGGIDGIIDQDVLGLRRIYVQAKRYATDNTVQRPETQAFVGALNGKADSGIFITTSRFSSGAQQYADEVPTRIVLIDGQRLARLMIRYGVGVQTRETVNIVEVDEDFFA